MNTFLRLPRITFRNEKGNVNYNGNIDDVVERLCEYEDLAEKNWINRDIKVKIYNKTNLPMPKDYGELKIVNNPKHIVVNGALYEKIDDSVLTIVNGDGL